MGHSGDDTVHKRPHSYNEHKLAESAESFVDLLAYLKIII